LYKQHALLAAFQKQFGCVLAPQLALNCRLIVCLIDGLKRSSASAASTAIDLIDASLDWSKPEPLNFQLSNGGGHGAKHLKGDSNITSAVVATVAGKSLKSGHVTRSAAVAANKYHAVRLLADEDAQSSHGDHATEEGSARGSTARAPMLSGHTRVHDFQASLSCVGKIRSLSQQPL